MIGALIGRRARLALLVAATAAISSQAVASATFASPSYSPLAFAGPAHAVPTPAQSLNVTNTGGGFAPAALPGTLAVQITGAAGSLSGGYAINNALGLAGIHVTQMSAVVTLVGVDAKNLTVAAFDTRTIATSGGDQVGQGVGYTYNTDQLAGKVTEWQLSVQGFAALATSPVTYLAFSGSDATPAIS